MTAAQSLKIYELLNMQFAKPEVAKQLTEAIEAVIDEKVADGNKTYEALLHKDLEILRLEMNSGTEKLHLEVNANSDKLRVEMKEQKLELIRWQFGFWVSLVLLILANWFFKK